MLLAYQQAGRVVYTMLLLTMWIKAQPGLGVGAAWQHGCGMGKSKNLIVGHLQLGRSHRAHPMGKTATNTVP